MKRALWRPALALALASALAAAPPAPAAQDDEVQLDSEIVTVDVTVTDAKGEYVTDVKPSEVRLFVDGEPREIAFFGASDARDLSRPLAVVFALDLSGSLTAEEVELQRRSASRFVDLVRSESVFAVLTFNQDVKVLQKFTSDAKDVGKAFEKVRDAGGSTRLFDALDQAVTMLRKGPESRKGRRLRRVVIAITDGFDSSSTIEPGELARRAAAAGVTFYSITIPSYIRTLEGGRERALTILDATRLVSATGGLDFSADTSDYTPIFRAIAEETAASYQLAYYPPESERTDGKFHTIRVEVVRPGTIVRASRQGYQADRRN